MEAVAADRIRYDTRADALRSLVSDIADLDRAIALLTRRGSTPGVMNKLRGMRADWYLQQMQMEALQAEYRRSTERKG